MYQGRWFCSGGSVAPGSLAFLHVGVAMSFSPSEVAYLLTRRDFCRGGGVLGDEKPPPLESRRLLVSALLDGPSPIGRRLSQSFYRLIDSTLPWR